MIVTNMYYIRQTQSQGGVSGRADPGCTIQEAARWAAKSIS